MQTQELNTQPLNNMVANNSGSIVYEHPQLERGPERIMRNESMETREQMMQPRKVFNPNESNNQNSAVRLPSHELKQISSERKIET
jgi:hypothetical protein